MKRASGPAGSEERGAREASKGQATRKGRDRAEEATPSGTDVSPLVPRFGRAGKRKGLSCGPRSDSPPRERSADNAVSPRMMLPWMVAWTPSLLLLSILQLSGATTSVEMLSTTSVPELPGPSSPNKIQLPSPKNVRFEAILFFHILRWEPGQNQTDNLSYEVQYMRYGNSWYPVPNCTRTPYVFCDLTLPTLDLDDKSYYAQVRAIAGDQKSNWTRTTTRFSKDDVILKIGDLELWSSGSTILGKIIHAKPPRSTENISYENLFKHFRAYNLSITRILENNKTFEINQLIEKEEFNKSFPEGGMFCIKVKPIVKSQTNKGLWSEKKCITITKTYLIVTTTSIIFASLLMVCLGVTYLSIRVYIRKPKKPPEVLASLANQKYSGILSKEHFKMKQDVIHPLDEAAFPKVSPDLKNSELHSSTDSGFSSTKQSLQSEDAQFLLPGLDPTAGGTQREKGPQQPTGSLSTSTSTSTISSDSGIYLHTLSSQSGQKCRRQPGSRDREDSCGTPHNSTATPLGSSQCLQYKRVSTILEDNSPSPKLSEEEAAVSVVFQGYLQQSKGTDESQEGASSLGKGSSPTDSPGYKCSTHRVVESDWPPLAQTKAYLKQSSPGQSLVVPGALPGQWTEATEKLSLLSLVSTDNLTTCEWSNTPDLPLAPTPSGILNTGPITLPLISSLHINE
ncbi:interleukin-10 receptor subunit alpha [Sminthopsis crassicaudata]|uniref:interleukin-10 receptor subunit alpha n=1 Tax=Sminthopsis crassicaudata TaxID=9301 RepID=UPI003D68A031